MNLTKRKKKNKGWIGAMLDSPFQKKKDEEWWTSCTIHGVRSRKERKQASSLPFHRISKSFEFDSLPMAMERSKRSILAVASFSIPAREDGPSQRERKRNHESGTLSCDPGRGSFPNVDPTPRHHSTKT